MVNDNRMEDMLTVREVARMLHIHPNTVRRWSNDGRVRAYRINNRGDRRYKKTDVARFVAEFSKGKTIDKDITR